MIITTGAPQKTSVFEREPTQGRGAMDFPKKRVPEMEYRGKRMGSFSAVMSWRSRGREDSS